MNYEEITQVIIDELKKHEVKQKPMTAEEIRAMQNNPMKKEKNEEMYNAFLCYDEQGNVCGYNIQVRLAEKEVYKHRFYLPVVDKSWNGVKKPEDLPDKIVKITYYGEFESQNEILKRNDLKLAQAMLLDLKVPGIKYLGEGFVGIANLDTLYFAVRNLKFAGYPVNETTKKMNEEKLFV